MAVPGITMAEWGPGDHAYSLYGLKVFSENGEPQGELAALPEMQKVRRRVVDLCKKNNLKFLNAAVPTIPASTASSSRSRTAPW